MAYLSFQLTFFSTMNQVHELYGIGSVALSSDHDHIFCGQEIGTKMIWSLFITFPSLFYAV